MNFRTAFILLLFLPLYSNAQDLTQDLAFFQKETKTYQKWLDKSGIGTVLSVRELEVKEKELTLYLEFHYQDIDSVVRAWNAVKTAFELEQPISLEQQLLYKLTNIMEVRESMASVAIFDTYDLRKEPLFLRGIYFEAGKVAIEESNPRSKTREITFSPSQLKGDKKKISNADFRKAYSKEVVFEKITQFAEKHFQRKTCLERNPKVRFVENEEVLRFKATDLCREVLTDAANPLLAQLLSKVGYDANWVKREKLDILIAYKEQDTGFQLHITIDGKYGSGLYSQVGRGGYYSMEIDFDAYLEDYADEFKELLRRAIK